MKAQKILSLDVEIIDELSKVKNASGLINDLLIDYFNKGIGLRKHELLKKIEETTHKKHELENNLISFHKELDDIEMKEKELKRIFEEIPQEVIDDWQVFPNMDEAILKNRFDNHYSKKFRDLTWDRLLHAFNKQKDIKRGD